MKSWKHTSSNSKTGHEIVRDGPNCSLQLQRSPVGCNEAVNWNSNDEGNIQPVDMLVEVGSGDGFIGDVCFLGFELSRARRLRHLCH